MLLDLVELVIACFQYLYLILSAPIEYPESLGDAGVAFSVLALGKDIFGNQLDFFVNDQKVFFTIIAVVLPLLLIFLGLIALNPKRNVLWFFALLIGLLFLMAGIAARIISDYVGNNITQQEAINMIIVGCLFLVVCGAAFAVQWFTHCCDGDNVHDAENFNSDEAMKQDTKEFNWTEQAEGFAVFIVLLIIGLIFVDVIPISNFGLDRIGLGSDSVKKVLLPVGAIFITCSVASCVWTVFSWFHRGRQIRWRVITFVETNAMRVLLIVMSLLYMPITSAVFVMFNCNRLTCPATTRILDEGSALVPYSTNPSEGCLSCTVAPNQQCPAWLAESVCAGSSSSRLEASVDVSCSQMTGYFFPAAGILIVAYIIGLPLLFFRVIQQSAGLVWHAVPAAPGAATDAEKWESQLRITDNVAKFLYQPTAYKYRFFRLYEIFRRFIATIVCTYVFRTSFSSGYIAIFVSLFIHTVTFILFAIVRPFIDQHENRTVLACGATIVGFLAFATVMLFDPNIIPDSAMIAILTAACVVPGACLVYGLLLWWKRRQSAALEQQELDDKNLKNLKEMVEDEVNLLESEELKFIEEEEQRLRTRAEERRNHKLFAQESRKSVSMPAARDGEANNEGEENEGGANDNPNALDDETNGSPTNNQTWRGATLNLDDGLDDYDDTDPSEEWSDADGFDKDINDLMDGKEISKSATFNGRGMSLENTRSGHGLGDGSPSDHVVTSPDTPPTAAEGESAEPQLGGTVNVDGGETTAEAPENGQAGHHNNNYHDEAKTSNGDMMSTWNTNNRDNADGGGTAFTRSLIHLMTMANPNRRKAKKAADAVEPPPSSVLPPPPLAPPAAHDVLTISPVATKSVMKKVKDLDGVLIPSGSQYAFLEESPQARSPHVPQVELVHTTQPVVINIINKNATIGFGHTHRRSTTADLLASTRRKSGRIDYERHKRRRAFKGAIIEKLRNEDNGIKSEEPIVSFVPPAKRHRIKVVVPNPLTKKARKKVQIKPNSTLAATTTTTSAPKIIPNSEVEQCFMILEGALTIEEVAEHRFNYGKETQVAVAKNADMKINKQVQRTFNLWLMLAGFLGFVALGFSFLGLLDNTTEVVQKPNFDSESTIENELVGYQHWENFTQHCCCIPYVIPIQSEDSEEMKAWLSYTSSNASLANSKEDRPGGSTKKYGRYQNTLAKVEKWVCANGRVKERARAYRVGNLASQSNAVSFNASATSAVTLVDSTKTVRGMCSTTFIDPTCVMTVDYTGKLTFACDTLADEYKRLW